MVKLEDVKTALSEIGVCDAETLKDEHFITFKFCYDLPMDSLDFEEFLGKIEEITGSKPPLCAKDYRLTVEEFIKACNTSNK